VKLGSLLALSLLFVSSSFALALPSTSAQSYQGSSSSSTTSSWVFAGAFLNYGINANLGASFALTNGSSLSFALNFTGTVKEAVNSISGDEANVTSTPNLALNEKTTYLNGTVTTKTESFTSANATTGTIPLSRINFGSVLQQTLNNVNSFAYFSPSLNTSLSETPAMFYQLNSGAKVVALHLSSTLSEQSTFPSQAGLSGSFSINGSFDSYTSLAQGIPLKEVATLKGSGTIQNAGQVLSAGIETGTAKGNFDLTVMLVDTNVNLSTGNAEQSVIQIPNYSTQIDVVSNSTITSASTSNNQLIVNVTGTSGTAGVLDVIISPTLLANSGITNASQVGVTLDGQTYSNYTVTDLGGSYLFTIYYHHSSHGIVLAFGNANLGTNKGTISSLSPSGGIPTTLLIEIAAAVAVVVIVLAAVFVRHSRNRGMTATTSSTSATPIQ
jgi:hypothetical protein